MLPGSVNFTVYRQDTFGFAFIFKDTAGNPFDMSNLGDVTMRVFVPGKEATPLFEPVISELNSTISGVFTPEQTVLLIARQYYFELRSTYLGRDVTLINGAIEAKDAVDGEGVTDAVSDVTIDLAAQTIEVVLGDSATIALQAKYDAEMARDKAREWAENPEDQPVEPGEFPALHWSAKSQGFAGDALTQADRAESEADRALSEGQQQVSLATAQANRAESEADRATAQVGLATIEADRATTQANRAETEADRAQQARADVENAADAFLIASQAIERVTLNQLMQ